MKVPDRMLDTRGWHGVMLGVVVVAMMQLGTPTRMGVDEPWPLLLSAESTMTDPTVALLHRRAVEALEQLPPADVAEAL